MSDQILEEQDDEPPKKGVHSDAEAAEFVYKHYPHIVYCENELYVFDDTAGLYRTDIFAAYAIICRSEKSLYSYEYSDKHGYTMMKNSYGNMQGLMKAVIPFLKQISRDPKWLLNIESSSPGYVLFKNGYHDGLTFYDKETHGFNPDIFFNARLECNYT